MLRSNLNENVDGHRRAILNQCRSTWCANAERLHGMWRPRLPMAGPGVRMFHLRCLKPSLLQSLRQIVVLQFLSPSWQFCFLSSGSSWQGTGSRGGRPHLLLRQPWALTRSGDACFTSMSGCTILMYSPASVNGRGYNELTFGWTTLWSCFGLTPLLVSPPSLASTSLLGRLRSPPSLGQCIVMASVSTHPDSLPSLSETLTTLALARPDFLLSPSGVAIALPSA